MARNAVAWVLALGLGLAPAAAQQMSPAEEAAYTALMQMTRQAHDLRNRGDLAGALAAHRAMLALIDRDLPDEPLTRATALHNITALTADQGRLDEALESAEQALALRLGNDAVPNALVSSYRLLATLLQDLDRLEPARAAIEMAVNLTLDDPQADHFFLIADFVGLAVLTARTGDLDGAMALMGQLEPLLPDLSPADATRVFVGLGRVQSLSGRLTLAEAAYREATTRAATIPADDPGWTVQDLVNVRGNLASMLLQQGREREAEPLFREVIALADRGASPLVRANLLDGLGTALAAMGEMQAAWDAQRHALDLRLQALPPDSPALAASFTLTGETILRAGDAATAHAALSRALQIATTADDRLRMARASLRLAAAEAALGRPAFARAAEAEALMASLMPPGSAEHVSAQFIAASVALAEGRAAEALPLARAALGPITDRLRLAGADAAVAATGGQDLRRMVLPVVAAAWEVDNTGLMDEAFQAAQWATMTAASRATQRMAARTAAATGDLALLVRGRQDLVNRWQVVDRDWLAALARGEGEAERAELDWLEDAISRAEAAVAQRFPDYAALVTPGVLSVAQVQTRLAPDETLVMLVADHGQTWVFGIAATGAVWHRAALTADDLDGAVRHLRADLDPTGPARAAVSLDEPAAPQGAAFDRRAAHDLYRALLEPLAPVLPPGGKVLVVADGALSSLPLAVLVASAPEGDDHDPAALMATDWLAGRRAFATLPSVQALGALRDRAATPPGTGFAGFGDPDFAGGGAPVQVAALYDGGIARTAVLRTLPPLPGTRRELLGLARQLQAPEGALRLGAAATEIAVRTADLSQAGLIVFATHGLVAGDIAGLAEPALAFSPPAIPGPDDDGLLTASEAAGLRLNADWVILSACNTAAADGTPGAEGLSGLAQAFLYAGARSLLVSHWPVGDLAAERLTQRAVAALAADPAGGQARALAAAMDDLRADPAFAHPSAWAPFVVVGGG